MKHVMKSIFVTLLLILAFNPSYSQDDTIELSIDPGTGLLLDPGTTYVFRSAYVFWKIKGGDNLRSFGIAGSSPPFTNPLPGGSNYINIGRRISKQFPYGEWKYIISYTLWTDPKDILFLDPKIAVVPTILPDRKTGSNAGSESDSGSGISSSVLYIILGAVIIIALAIVMFFRSRRKSK